MTVPKAVLAIATALDRVTSDRAYLETLDEDERQWMVIEGLCEDLHPLGPVQFPSVHMLRDVVDRPARDAAIRREFDGRNYQALARKYKRSERQVRRIVDDARRRSGSEAGDA